MTPDAIWLVILATMGAIAGSIASFFFRTAFLRSFMVGVVGALALGLLLQWMHVRLPFEGALVALVRGAGEQISGLFAQLVRR